ncbi:MAG: LytTR family DNA-binding domain-containing protein [Bacteroidota bacterium]
MAHSIIKPDPLTAILIDDELHCLETLQWQLMSYCPWVKIIGRYLSAQEALSALKQKPDVAFVDIEMPHMNAFEMLEALNPIDFQLIFTTAYDEYAVKAFKVNAIDYLLKPIDKNELIAAVQKVERSPVNKHQYQALKQFLQSQHSEAERITFSTQEGLEVVAIQDIIRCQSDSNYSDILLVDGQKITISRTLKEVEEMLKAYSFFRVHHSHLVNLWHVRKYLRGDGGTLLMSDQSQVSVARSRKEQLLNLLTQAA